MMQMVMIIVENEVKIVELECDKEERENDDEEMMRKAEMDSAIRRTFDQDDSKGNAPLSSENAMRKCP